MIQIWNWTNVILVDYKHEKLWRCFMCIEIWKWNDDWNVKMKWWLKCEYGIMLICEYGMMLICEYGMIDWEKHENDL
jgi:hypothetical protein